MSRARSAARANAADTPTTCNESLKHARDDNDDALPWLCATRRAALRAARKVQCAVARLAQATIPASAQALPQAGAGARGGRDGVRLSTTTLAAPELNQAARGSADCGHAALERGARTRATAAARTLARVGARAVASRPAFPSRLSRAGSPGATSPQLPAREVRASAVATFRRLCGRGLRHNASWRKRARRRRWRWRRRRVRACYAAGAPRACAEARGPHDTAVQRQGLGRASWWMAWKCRSPCCTLRMSRRAAGSRFSCGS